MGCRARDLNRQWNAAPQFLSRVACALVRVWKSESSPGLSRSLYRRYPNSLYSQSAGHFHFLAGKLTSLLLSGFVQVIHALVIAISEHEFAPAFDADKCAKFLSSPMPDLCFRPHMLSLM